MPFTAKGMDLVIVILSQRNIMKFLLQAESKNKLYKLPTKHKKNDRHREGIYGYQRGRVEGRDSKGLQG